ncbi:GRASP55/65 PDZ-like domain-containing protein [Radiomyces spectabilis]|uniref:GRASP55/65 PDZ-like domain-containing protein n=1 Tax=Radiomyces spectabilis TaxID=64574 RepID=UPI00222114D8|nr:GRASP55/65 PDZ-like domain-containing protein [Radiomyces spectabilis]KAI8380897.1 GRASP55/65 PDZ-like domain-containing protein [Radiomyces spectabilis]
MGGTQSTEQGRHGFHVLKVKENSPAFLAGIEQFFDYIISINGTSLENGDSQILLKTLEESKDNPVTLQVYSSKEDAIREVVITPNDQWHTDPNEKSLLGCSIRFCTYERAGEHVWHILEVLPNSPAEMAGLIPESDFIIGSPHTVLSSEDGFYNLVDQQLGKPLRLYVYNTEWDSCREVIIIPNNEWGGVGSLGCDVGYGLLHRIPQRLPAQEDTGKAGESVSSDTNFSSADFVDHSTARASESNTSQVHSLDDNTTTRSLSQEHALKEAQNTALPESPQLDHRDASVRQSSEA